MSAPALLIVTLALGGAAGELPAKSQTAQKDGAIEVGEPFPGFAGWKLDGELFALKQLLKTTRAEDKPVVIAFGAHWCKPCIESLPVLAATVKRHQAEAIVVAVRDDDEKARRFLREAKVDLPAVPDPHGSISGTMKLEQLPRTYVLRPDGVVHAIFVVEGQDLESVLGRALEEAAAVKVGPKGKRALRAKKAPKGAR